MTQFNWFPGHMNKALKNITNQLPAVDLILEVVDARAPLASTNSLLDKIAGHKPRLKLLSKVDWADPQITPQWLNWYQQHQIEAMILDYSNSHFREKLISTISHTLKPKLERWRQKGLLHPQINVLVVGIPNVGKSTLINRLVQTSKTMASNRPGVTRGLQLVQLTKSINLIDSPGVLPSQLKDWVSATNLVAINSIKREVYPRWEVGISLIERLYRQYPTYWKNNLLAKTSPKLPLEAKDLLELMAHKKKYSITPNFNWEEKIIQPFIDDLANGKFPFSLECPNPNP